MTPTYCRQQNSMLWYEQSFLIIIFNTKIQPEENAEITGKTFFWHFKGIFTLRAEVFLLHGF